MSLVLRADIFNVFDSQEPISYVKEDIPMFGKVWARQQPRQARLRQRLSGRGKKIGYFVIKK